MNLSNAVNATIAEASAMMSIVDDDSFGINVYSYGISDDIYNVVIASDVIVENPGGGEDLVYSPVTYTLGDYVENLTLIGLAAIDGIGNAQDNILIGNDEDNHLIGLEGQDTLDGQGGADTMEGGAGDDKYIVDGFGDIVTELTGEGIDTVNASITYNLKDTDGAGNNGGNVEQLVLTGTDAINGVGNDLDNVIEGNDSANKIWGNNGADVLNGRDGNDQLFGGDGDDELDGGVGDDAMAGGKGNDTYIVDRWNDFVSELAGQGFDTVNASVTYNLKDTDGAGSNGDNVEKLVLTGGDSINGIGNDLDNFIFGNDADNTIWGNDGADTLKGYGGNDHLEGWFGNDLLNGGAGNDTLVGGRGSDTYIVDWGDIVTELVDQGFDTVETSYTYNLKDTDGAGSNGGNVEKLVLTGTAPITGIGNDLNNFIYGNDANNRIWGNDGSDTLKGNGGNDELYGGNDSDILYGGAWNDLLDGGSGEDTLVGGRGNDSYIVDHWADIVTELPGEGFDTVEASISYNLKDTDGAGNYGDNVEKLVLAGVEPINGIGNDLNNFIYGNDANNKIWGNNGADTLNGNGGDDELYGGDGNDTLNGGNGNDLLVGGKDKDLLWGGVGNDIFDFNALNETWAGINRDVIEDFEAGDKIDVAGIDADLSVTGDQGFTFDSGSGFSNTTTFTHAGQLYYDISSNILWGNNDGDAAADFSIEVQLSGGLTTLVASDLSL